MDFSKATKDNVTYQHYKNLLSIRNAYTDVFARGSRTVVAGSDEEGYDVVSRSYGGTTLYVGMNIKDTAKEVKVPVSLAAGTEVKDLYSGATYTVGSDKTVAVTIPAAKDGGTVILAEVKKTVDSGKDRIQHRKRFLQHQLLLIRKLQVNSRMTLKKQLQRVAMTMKQLHMYAYSDLQWLQSQQLHIARRELATKTAFKLNIL